MCDDEGDGRAWSLAVGLSLIWLLVLIIGTLKLLKKLGEAACS